MGNTTVNLLSLDIEGAEIQVEKALSCGTYDKITHFYVSEYAFLQVLETIPWESLDIEVVLVETDHLGEVFPGSRHQLHSFFDNHGYEYAATICKKQKYHISDFK